jgi:hypothetical protein
MNKTLMQENNYGLETDTIGSCPLAGG